MKRHLVRTSFFSLGALAVLGAFYFIPSEQVVYNGASVVKSEAQDQPVSPKPVVAHLETPEPLKSVYMSQCYASMPSLRTKLVRLIEETELNAVVIDIKDYTGTVSFETGNSTIDSIGGTGCKVSDMKEFVEELHSKGIYVIGRVTVFQDPQYTKLHPELAVKKKSDGSVWRDRKGLAFVDVGARPFWDYIVAIATSSHAIGFDEINFDYIRFPSDGNMSDIAFTHSEGLPKREALRKFFEYLDAKMSEAGIPTSADVFGMVTTNTDDLNIGQVLEIALVNFDYVAPMVYPSHYPPMFNGWKDPNKVPYEIIKFSMDTAVSRLNLLRAEIASSTPNSKLLERIKPTQLRTWIQDFDYPVAYTPDMVRAQIQATYDSGLTSWMLWDPANTYTPSALLLSQ